MNLSEYKELSRVILPQDRDLNPQIVDSNERIELYETIHEMLSRSNENLCHHHSAESDPEHHFLNIEKRIGSDSVAGLVYLAKINGLSTALKIMPIVNNKSFANNQDEIKIAKLFSNIVLNQQTIYFPIVYDSYYCTDVVYPINTTLLPVAFKYNVDRALLSLFEEKMNNQQLNINKAKQRKFTVDNNAKELSSDKNFMQKYIDDCVNWFNNNYKMYGLPEKNEITKEILESKLKPELEGNILISELANMDLKQFVENHLDTHQIIPDNVWFSILEQVLNGINIMQQNNVIHYDLHLGNVLLLMKNDDFTCLIHDFGNSSIKMPDFEWRDEDRAYDILKLASLITTYKFKGDVTAMNAMSEKMQDFIRQFLNHIIRDKFADSTYINSLINYLKEEKEKAKLAGVGGKTRKKRKHKRHKQHNKYKKNKKTRNNKKTKRYK